MLDWKELCTGLFPEGHDVTRSGDVLAGIGFVGGQPVAVIGTAEHAAIGVETALKLAALVLDVLKKHPRRPILMLVDTQGQKLARSDELLGNNSCLGHLAECFALARHNGHQLISVVYSEAVSGGFLSLGMMADSTYAVEGAEIRVMALPAMSRITKLPLEELQALCRTTAILGPGVDNYVALGAVKKIWSQPLDQCLLVALQDDTRADERRDLGASRGGRTHAAKIARRVREDQR